MMPNKVTITCDERTLRFIAENTRRYIDYLNDRLHLLRNCRNNNELTILCLENVLDFSKRYLVSLENIITNFDLFKGKEVILCV